MTTVTFVDDPQLDRTLGETVAQEIRDAVQPGGDCAGCDRPLGTGPLRIDVQSDDVAHIIYPRHAACRPAPDLANMVILRGENTYLVSAAMTHMPYRAPETKRRWWWHLSRPQPPQPEFVPVPVILVNPSIDGFFIPRDHESLITRYMNREEFRQPAGGIQIEQPLPADSTLSLAADPDLITITDAVTRYAIDAPPPPLVQAIHERGGALLAVTFRHWISATERDPGALRRIMTDTEGTAVAWLPYEPSEGFAQNVT